MHACGGQWHWHDPCPQGEDPAQGGHLGGPAAQDRCRRATSGERPSQRGGTGRVRPTQRGGTGRVRPTQRGETLMGMMVMMRRYAEHFFVVASALTPVLMKRLCSGMGMTIARKSAAVAFAAFRSTTKGFEDHRARPTDPSVSLHSSTAAVCAPEWVCRAQHASPVACHSFATWTGCLAF